MKTKPTLLKKIIVITGIILGIFIVLNVGMVIGARRVSYMNQHGSIGQITKIDQDSIFIKDPDGIEKLIVVGTSTEIRNKDKNKKIFYGCRGAWYAPFVNARTEETDDVVLFDFVRNIYRVDKLKKIRSDFKRPAAESFCI